MKKLVSLVLAVAMVLSLVTFASAAETNETYAVKAVETLGELDIMRGDENGDLHLDEYLTREEMFSIMYRLTEAVGLMDDNEKGKWELLSQGMGAYVPDATNVAFWAKPYAAYNWLTRIFSGDENGNLNPKGNLSYYECLTVMLRALGFTNDVLLADGQWRTNVVLYGLYGGLLEYIPLDVDFNAPIIRKHIAVMVYNALQADTVVVILEDGEVVDINSTGNSLLEENFGFVSPDDIVSAGLVTSYHNGNKKIYVEGKDWEDWFDADELGVDDEDLPALYGQYITWVRRPNKDVLLRAAEIEDLEWQEIVGFRGTDFSIGSKGYKADKSTAVDYGAADCKYVKVTANGQNYFVPYLPSVYESINDYLYAEDNARKINVVLGDAEYKTALDYNYIRFLDKGDGKGIVFFANQDILVQKFNKTTHTYNSTNKTIKVPGKGDFTVDRNLYDGFENGDVIIIEYAYLYQDDIAYVRAVTEIEPTQVNGGRLTATLSGGTWKDVKLDGEAVDVDNNVTTADLAYLYALPAADASGNDTGYGYVYLLDGYIVAHSNTEYEGEEDPETPSDEYYAFVTSAPTFAFDGALLRASFAANVDGDDISVTLTLKNASALGDAEDTYTLAEAKALIDEGKVLKIDPLGGKIDETGQKVDVVENIGIAETGYVYRWFNLSFGGLNKQVAVVDDSAEADVINLDAEGFVTVHKDALVADNVDGGAKKNTIADLIAGEEPEKNFKVEEICKTAYYVYEIGEGESVIVFYANPEFDESERSKWDNGTPTAPTGTTYMLLAKAPSLTVKANGDVTATLEGYIDGVLTTYGLNVKKGTTATALAGILLNKKVVEIVRDESTGYDTCTTKEGENYSTGYVVCYVDIPIEFDEGKLYKDYIFLYSDAAVEIEIEIGADNQVIKGDYAEEPYDTLKDAMDAYNAAEGKTLTLKDIAKTAYVKYTANSKTYVIFSANNYKSDKRADFVEWAEEEWGND